MPGSPWLRRSAQPFCGPRTFLRALPRLAGAASDHDQRILLKVRLFKKIRRRVRKLDLLRHTVQIRTSLSTRVSRGIVQLLPHGLPLFVERHDAETRQPLNRQLESIPHHDAVDHLLALWKNPPPTTDRPYCRPCARPSLSRIRPPYFRRWPAPPRHPCISRFLRGFPLRRHVFAAAENLHLCQLQQLPLSRKLNAHKARPRALRPVRWHHHRPHARHHEIPARMPRPLARQRLDIPASALPARSAESFCAAVTGTSIV